MSKARLSNGFTLIELMIVVAIVAILASIAYPSYQEQVAKGRRADAKSVLLQSQQWLERFYSENYRYDRNAAGTDVNNNTLFPSKFSKSPVEGAAVYNITVTASQTNYTLTAAPTASMTSDRCGSFVMFQTGRKTVSGYSTTKFASEAEAIRACWQ